MIPEPGPANHTHLRFWEAIWQSRQQASCLKQTQLRHPEKWQAFYDRAAGLWSEITGSGGHIAANIAALIADRR